MKRSAAAALALLAACQAAPATPVASKPPSVELPSVRVATSPVEAGPPDSGGPDGVMNAVYAADSTLVVICQRSLLARAADGTLVRKPIQQSAEVVVSSDIPGVLLAAPDDADSVLLATPTLEQLFAGHGDSNFAGGTLEPVIAASRELVVQGRDAHKGALHLAMPAEATSVSHVLMLAGGTRFNASYAFATDAGDEDVAGALFDADSGARVGPGLPITTLGTLPRAAQAGLVGFAVDQHRVRRIALDTGKVVRQTTLRCPPDQMVGNPTASPDGKLLLVTCADDGVVLDGVTLAERRRIPRIIPGCDNGPLLGGTLLPDGHTLLLGGCGGGAKLDLASGRFKCADNEGLLGAPYMPMMPMTTGAPGPGGFGPAFPAWQAPPDRQHVPACGASQTESTPFGRSGRYRLNYVEHIVIDTPEGAIQLADGDVPTVAPDEQSFSYQHDGHVIVRALPGGAQIADLVP
jgi:hypothetical protein